MGLLSFEQLQEGPKVDLSIAPHVSAELEIDVFEAIGDLSVIPKLATGLGD